MKLLHIDSSILGENSVSRQLSAAIVARLVGENPGITVSTRDLATDPIGHLIPPDLAAASPEARAVLNEFLATDIVVIGAPMYNFTVPSQLKAWIDRILVAGETFSYNETGPFPLAGGKRVVVALSRGGLYGADTPMAPFEHLETYLGNVFGFIGITPEFIIAEGINYGPEARAAAIDQSLTEVDVLAG